MPYEGKPSWAQNDAMMMAYVHGLVSYYYRVNDDTKFSTPGWTELFIDTLQVWESMLVSYDNWVYLKNNKNSNFVQCGI